MGKKRGGQATATNVASTPATDSRILRSSTPTVDPVRPSNIPGASVIHEDEPSATPSMLAVQASDVIEPTTEDTTEPNTYSVPASTIIFAGSHPGEFKSDLEDVADNIRCGTSECVATDKGFFVFLFDVTDTKETSRVFDLLHDRHITTPLEAFKPCFLPCTLSKHTASLVKFANDDVGTQTAPELLVATSERAAQTTPPSSTVAVISTQTWSKKKKGRTSSATQTEPRRKTTPQPPPAEKSDSRAQSASRSRINRQHVGDIDIIQCFRCCRFNHYSSDCRSPIRCNRCGGGHYHQECKTPRDSPRCCNCSGSHASSYGGCPARRQYLERTTGSKMQETGFHHPQEASHPRRRHRFDAAQISTLQDLLDSLLEVAVNQQPRPFKRKFERTNRDPARSLRHNEPSITLPGAESGHPSTADAQTTPVQSPDSQDTPEALQLPGTCAAE